MLTRVRHRPTTRGAATTATIGAAVAGLLVGACSSDPAAGPVEPLPDRPTGTEMLCDHVARSSAALVLGSTKLEPVGQLRVYATSIAAECVIDNTSRKGSEIMVQTRQVEERTLADVNTESARPDVDFRYPADIGDPAFVLGNEVKAYGVIVRNGYIVKVSVSLPAEGRDAVADTIVLTRQIAFSLPLVS